MIYYQKSNRPVVVPLFLWLKCCLPFLYSSPELILYLNVNITNQISVSMCPQLNEMKLWSGSNCEQSHGNHQFCSLAAIIGGNVEERY